MKLTTQDVATKHNKTDRAIQISANRASQKSLKYIMIDGECYYFFYKNGLGRGGKTLYFVSANETSATAEHFAQNQQIGDNDDGDYEDRNKEAQGREYIDSRTQCDTDTRECQPQSGKPSAHGGSTSGQTLARGKQTSQSHDHNAERTAQGVCRTTASTSVGLSHGNLNIYNSVSAGSLSRNSNSQKTKQVERPIKIKDLENMTRVKAVNEFNGCPRGFKKTLWAEQIAKKYEVTTKTLYEWAKTLKNDEVVVKDENLNLDFRAKFKSNSFDIKALEWAVAFWIHNPLASKTRIFEELEKKTMETGWRIGSYKSFARLLSSPEVKIMLKRTMEGSRGIRNDIAPFLLRDLNLYDSMELICGDQLVFDFKVYDPDGVIVNPNGYVWIDMGSGAIIGVDIVLGKYNKYSIGRALKGAMRFGVPDAIYTDNGKPELSNYITEVRSQLGGILFKDFDDLDPRIVHKKAKPANSRAKPIENIFNHVQTWMRDEIIAEKGGSGYHKRGANKKELVKEYMKDLLLSYEEFIHYFSRAVQKWNEHYNQSRKIVPIEAFITKLQASNRSRFDEATLEYIFAPRKMLKVRNSWVQTTIDGEKRTYSHPLLARYVGKSVEVRLQEKNPYSVSIIDPSKNEFICEAELVERIDPRDDAIVRATMVKNEMVVKAIDKSFGYYKELYKPNYRLGAYSHVANKAKTKKEEVKKQVKKVGMSNEELLKAM